MTRLQKYQILVDETEMLTCRAAQLEKEMEELKMIYSCAQDANIMKLFRKAKRQYDAIVKQVAKNQQKIKKFNWR